MAGLPNRLDGWVAGPADRPPSWIVRLLGARMVAQAAAVRAAGSHGPARAGRALRVGAGVDLLHGASMVGAAAVWPRYRRSALASAAMAFLSAGAGLLAAGGTRR